MIVRLKHQKKILTDHEKFNLQRLRAAERGVVWNLEYWEWLQIWQDSGHFHERGNKKGLWVMGRNGDQGPYEFGNVKIIPFETNCSQAWATRKLYKSNRDLKK